MTVRNGRRGMRRGRRAALTLLALAAVPASAKAQDAEASAPYPRAAIGVGSIAGGYAEARWAEDWSALRDRERRKDVFDRLKYIPLSQDGEVWLSLSGETRLRTALTTSPGLREGADQRLDTLRLVGGADLHIGPHLRVFGELAHGGAGGDNYGNPVGGIRNDLAVSQAFVDVTGEVGGREVGVRYGRQFFIDGSPYLISTRNGATLLTPFNGVRGWMRGEHWRADLFDLRPTRLGTGDVSDERTDDARRFSGLNVSTQVPGDWFGGSKLYFDPFVWRYDQDARRWGAETAKEERTYVGIRLWGEAGPAQLDWTLARQTGRFGDRDIEALHVFTTQSAGRWGKRCAAHQPARRLWLRRRRLWRRRDPQRLDPAGRADLLQLPERLQPGEHDRGCAGRHSPQGQNQRHGRGPVNLACFGTRRRLSGHGPALCRHRASRWPPCRRGLEAPTRAHCLAKSEPNRALRASGRWNCAQGRRLRELGLSDGLGEF